MATQQKTKAVSTAATSGAITLAEAAASKLAELDVEATHPAVDEDLRAGTTSDQNRIDFNDPNIDGRKAVAQNLSAQAK